MIINNEAISCSITGKADMAENLTDFPFLFNSTNPIRDTSCVHDTVTNIVIKNTTLVLVVSGKKLPLYFSTSLAPTDTELTNSIVRSLWNLL